MAEDSRSPGEINREFLDTFLQYGIGHYFTLAKLLSGRISGELSDPEKLSIGMEVSALAGASLDSLVAWYHALRHWSVRGGQQDLAQILSGVRVPDAERLDALKLTRDGRADEFCYAFGIPWKREDLRSRRVDETNWRYTVDQARLNISKVLEDLSPVDVETSQASVFRYLNSVKRGFYAGAGGSLAIPTVKVMAEGESTKEAVADQLAIPTDPAQLSRLADLTGNAAIGLFLLIRLLYISSFGRDPRSPAFVMIWQELHATGAQGA